MVKFKSSVFVREHRFQAISQRIRRISKGSSETSYIDLRTVDFSCYQDLFYEHRLLFSPEMKCYSFSLFRSSSWLSFPVTDVVWLGHYPPHVSVLICLPHRVYCLRDSDNFQHHHRTGYVAHCLYSEYSR